MFSIIVFCCCIYSWLCKSIPNIRVILVIDRTVPTTVAMSITKVVYGIWMEGGKVGRIQQKMIRRRRGRVPYRTAFDDKQNEKCK